MRIAIIGAGASGLPTVRVALEYGHEPVVFEKSAHIGGLWRYRDEETTGILHLSIAAVLTYNCVCRSVRHENYHNQHV
jgi:cation diffusion facilitator CzcD-associated flavoprotein CzcO